MIYAAFAWASIVLEFVGYFFLIKSLTFPARRRKIITSAELLRLKKETPIITAAVIIFRTSRIVFDALGDGKVGGVIQIGIILGLQLLKFLPCFVLAYSWGRWAKKKQAQELADSITESSDD